MKPVTALAGTKINQVIIGSCTNGSWDDMYTVAEILRGQTVHPSVSVIAYPGSARVLEAMARHGLIEPLLAAGVQLAATSCGGCAGLSYVPATGTKSLRTFNRNFPGRSGNGDDQIYLCSPAVAAASALKGEITDPRTLGIAPPIPPHPNLSASSAGFVPGDGIGSPDVTVVKGPKIQTVPVGQPPSANLRADGLLKLAVFDVPPTTSRRSACSP